VKNIYLKKMLKSIQNIQKYYETTGSAPVLVLASDLNLYVCKYAYADTSTLEREYLASCFLKIWHIYTPEVEWIQIHHKHNIFPNMVANKYFIKPCFGSKYIDNHNLINFQFHSEADISTFLLQRESFLKIALFDLWVCHQDRFVHNSNLLQSYEEMKFFCAIDHSSIFDNGNQYQDNLSVLSYEKSILNTPIFKQSLQLKPITSIELQILFDSFKNDVEICLSALDSIFDTMPNGFAKDRGEQILWIKNILCNPKRLVSVQETYSKYLHQSSL
jgi:hypothetical protein